MTDRVNLEWSKLIGSLKVSQGRTEDQQKTRFLIHPALHSEFGMRTDPADGPGKAGKNKVFYYIS